MIALVPDVRDRLIENQRHIDKLQLEQAFLAAELASTDLWEREGFNHPGDWLRINCHLTSTAAADLLTVGEQAARMPESLQALRSGDIGYAHVKVMARTADAIGKAFREQDLLPLALKHSPGKFHFKCLHYRHSVDAKGFDAEQEDLHERRTLRLSTTEDGCLLIAGALDPVGGAVVRNALESLARPSGDQDDRTREQRLADAVVDLAESKTDVQLHVTSSVETLLGLIGAPGAENEFSLPISASAVARWACDCSVTRVLMQDSVVIDAGRSRRVVSGAMRKALVARDGHCQWPGCERPASWCDGHHLVHWTDGGDTDLDQVVLLCRRHHRLVHEGGWQLIKTEDQALAAIAPLVSFGPD